MLSSFSVALHHINPQYLFLTAVLLTFYFFLASNAFFFEIWQILPYLSTYTLEPDESRDSGFHVFFADLAKFVIDIECVHTV